MTRRMCVVVLLAMGWTVGVSSCGGAQAGAPASEGRSEFGLADGGVGDGPGPVAVDPGVCQDLVSKTCNVQDAGPLCEESSQCQAARILLAHGDESRCDGGLQDPVHYPACTDVLSCEDLVRRCCGGSGGAGACQDDVTCARAMEVELQRDESLCAQALRDEVNFPRCTRTDR
ncbi:MAG: hypothetical protein AB2A00_39985 [Myxococcota bacterium]